MAHATAVSIDEMRGQLITLDEAKERLAVTEPLSEVTFAGGTGARIRIGEGWKDVDLPAQCDAFLRISTDGPEYQLSRQAVRELGSECHIPHKGQEWMTANVLQDVINYGLSSGFGSKEFKLLTKDSTVLAMTRKTITPFSNLRLVDVVEDRLRNFYGTDTEILVDYKLHHDLEQTALRLIVPGYQRVIAGTRVEGDDTWSTGIQIKNSLTGLKQTDIGGYLFRWWCTNGCYDTMNHSGGFSRRGQSSDEEVYEWAARSVDSVLGGLEHTLDGVQDLTRIPVEGEVSTVIRDLFAQHSIPKREQDRVISAMADMGGDLTMYDVQQAITQAANADDVDERSVAYLLTAGGHIAHATHARCNEDNPCRRLMPANWAPPSGN